VPGSSGIRLSYRPQGRKDLLVIDSVPKHFQHAIYHLVLLFLIIRWC
jgi:hypothetical protein